MGELTTCPLVRKEFSAPVGKRETGSAWLILRSFFLALYLIGYEEDAEARLSQQLSQPNPLGF